MSGGLLGVGEVNRSSIGQIVMPSLRPYRAPFIVKGKREQPWRNRIRAARGLFIAMIVIISVLGALLLLGLGFLAYRLCTAGKRSTAPLRGSPFEDGVAMCATPHIATREQDIGGGVSSLENHSRRHGVSGGI